MVAVAPGVQNLQRDLAAFGMDGVGNEAMLADLPRKAELRRLRVAPAGKVGRESAGDDQPGAAARPLGVERRHALETVLLVFQTGVHRTHQGAIPERREAEVERRQKVGIGGRGGCLGHVAFSGKHVYKLSKQALGYYRHTVQKMQGP